MQWLLEVRLTHLILEYAFSRDYAKNPSVNQDKNLDEANLIGQMVAVKRYVGTAE